MSEPIDSVADHISVDDHLVEPPDLWVRRLPTRFKDAGPRVERVNTLRSHDPQLAEARDAINDGWIFDGKVDPLHATGMRRYDGQMTPEHTFEDMRPGCYDSVARLDDMDADHVAAAMCFPTMPGFSGTKFSVCGDKELGLACIQAYNDFIFEEWAGPAPGRYIPLILIPLWDPELAAREIEQNANRGARAIAFSEDPYRQGFPSLHHPDHWDPVFAAAQDAELPLCVHMGGSSFVAAKRDDRPWFTNHALCFMNSQLCLADWVTSGQFVKFPRLKVCISEGGIGWIPHMLEHLDLMFDLYHEWAKEGQKPPSEYFATNIYGCFIDDPVGARLLDLIGVENVMVETDYPHGDSTWPHSHERILSQIAHLAAEDQYQILRGNAERVFNFTPSGVGQK